MTKKVRQWRGKARTTASVIKSVNKDTFASAICPTNVEEQKQKFLEFGKTPEFQHRGTETELEEIYSKPRSEIRFDLLGEALHILKTVKEKYGDAENYYSEMYGEKISKDEATDIIVDYLKENRIDGQMTVIWCSDLPCSGRMMWQGPHVKYKRPEARKYSMWIKDSKDNNFLRLHGIRCLSDHEIGTHFFRSYNDGLQPWFADRTRFGLRGLSCLDQLRSEEGLAAINTILNAKVRYLWGPALLYYIACKATEMTFKQLFEHLSIYVANPEWRWRHCVRVKRGLLNPNDIGGYGKDQCYFEGAVEILRNLDNIDFRVLMSGKICWDEISRVKKLARLECIQMPAFMRNQEKYKKTLKQIAHMNGLHMDHAKFKAPLAYLRRLKRGRRIGVVGGSKKVRRKGRRSSVLSLSKGLGSKGEIEGSFGHLGSDNDDDVDDGDDESGQDSGSDEGFYFQQYSLQGENEREQDFFEKLKKNVGKNGEENEVTNNYSNYYKSLVNNFENLKKDKKQEETNEELVDVEVKSSVISYKKSTFEDRDWENDCVKTQYRCVSRASVQMLLSLPSNSLNSRNRNSNAEDVESIRPKSYIQRPLSSFVPSLAQDDEQTADLSNSQVPVLSKPPCLPLSRISPLSTSVTCTSASQEHFIPKSANQTCTNSIATQQHSPSNDYHTKPGASDCHTKPGASDCHTKPGASGFLYQDNDVLTDDMIKVNAGNQDCDLGQPSQCQGQPNSSSKPKLLHRRVKSAANLLPKF